MLHQKGTKRSGRTRIGLNGAGGSDGASRRVLLPKRGEPVLYLCQSNVLWLAALLSPEMLSQRTQCCLMPFECLTGPLACPQVLQIPLDRLINGRHDFGLGRGFSLAEVAMRRRASLVGFP